MLSISRKAAERLREELIHKCFQVDIGFRILVTTGEAGKATFNIKFDMQRQGDEVIESEGVKVFLDASSAAQIKDYQVDYHDEPGGGFFLKIAQKIKDKQD
jgi:Fe-S cluster assembly iron-binding protein IscA